MGGGGGGGGGGQMVNPVVQANCLHSPQGRTSEGKPQGALPGQARQQAGGTISPSENREQNLFALCEVDIKL